MAPVVTEADIPDLVAIEDKAYGVSKMLTALFGVTQDDDRQQELERRAKR